MNRPFTPDPATIFVASHTEPLIPPLTPELRLALACDPIDVWQKADLAGFDRPFWAFAWPGGQALARHLLDRPELVAGKRVVDIGSGSAISSIAALKAGAAHAMAADTDPVACAAALRNATLNGVTLSVTVDDLLGTRTDADVIMIGDLFYEPELATRVSRFLEGALADGAMILYADRTTARRPPIGLELLAEHEATPCPGLVEDHIERARVWLAGNPNQTPRRPR